MKKFTLKDESEIKEVVVDTSLTSINNVDDLAKIFRALYGYEYLEANTREHALYGDYGSYFDLPNWRTMTWNFDRIEVIKII